jgi:hypothetical protein
MAIKPPLGVSPHWFAYPMRIKELHEAIGRFIEHIEKNRHIEDHSQHWKVIAQWASEMEMLALLEAELTERERNEQK